jgi:hypothetical protein
MSCFQTPTHDSYLTLNVQDNNKDESFSNFFVPSRRKEQQEQNAKSSGSSNYISLMKKDPTTPLATARSNVSYDDTPRARPVNNIRAGFLRFEPNSAAHLLGPIEQEKDIQDGGQNGSALQHWLSDTERASLLQSASHRPGVPALGLEPGTDEQLLAHERMPVIVQYTCPPTSLLTNSRYPNHPCMSRILPAITPSGRRVIHQQCAGQAIHPPPLSPP